jgi:hypothetical protein
VTERDDEKLIAETVGFYRGTLDWLAHHHANLGKGSTHDLDGDDRWNAVWKLSGQSISHGYALVTLLDAGFTGPTWSVMRSIHEVNRLLAAVSSEEETRIPRRWLANQEVKQSEARAAEAAEAEKVAEEMRTAGVEPVEGIEEASREIYAAMSKAAHHRRAIVDEAVDAENRAMVYAADPDAARRLAFVIYAGALLHELALLVGGAIAVLYGPPFYAEHLAPMLRRMEELLAALDFIETARRLGLR